MNFRQPKRAQKRRPPALGFGDTVALIRPASHIEMTAFRKAQQSLRELGFCVADYPGRLSKDSFFSGNDRERALEWHWAFSEPGVKAVFACRGGYGSIRMAAQFSKKQISQWVPKIFVGYSDLTYMHQWLHNQLGYISFHGALVGRLKKPELEQLVQKLVQLPNKKISEEWPEVRIVRKGTASGTLVGGNLSLLPLVGPAALPRQPLILVLEDVNEDYYRLDRMIWSLIDAGYSQWIRGVILGRFHACGKKDAKSFRWERFLKSLELLCKGPIWQKANFGHGVRNQRILPLGCEVSIKAKKIQYREPWVQKS